MSDIWWIVVVAEYFISKLSVSWDINLAIYIDDFDDCLSFFSNCFVTSCSLVWIFLICSCIPSSITCRCSFLSSTIGVLFWFVVRRTHNSSLSIWMSWLSSFMSTFSFLDNMSACVFVFPRICHRVKL